MQFTTELGTIGISNDVIAIVASDTASTCFGVKGLASSGAMDGIVRLLKGDTRKKGVKVRCCEDGTVALQLKIIVLSGVNIQAVCSSIIKEVKYMVTKRTGITVGMVEVLVEAVKA